MTSKDLRRAYYPDYFSTDNILACQTLIPCLTEMRLPKFGFLVPDCNSEDLPVGINVELPLWAARVLCRPGREYISVSIPPGFKEAHREVIDEDATRVDLRKVHPQYFEAGHLCTSLFHNDAGELAEMLPEVLQQRIMCIGESTITTPRNPWVQRIINTKSVSPEYMDILETSIYRDSKEGSRLIEEWLEPLRTENSSSSSSSQSIATPSQQRQVHNVHPSYHAGSTNNLPSPHSMASGAVAANQYPNNLPYHPQSFPSQGMSLREIQNPPHQQAMHHNIHNNVQQPRYHQNHPMHHHHQMM